MRNIVAMSLAAVGIVAGAATAEAKGLFFYSPHAADSTYAYNYNVIAGVTPDWYSTFIRGQRCSYEYRVQYGERVRITVCN